MNDWRMWLNGLVGALISASANTITLLIVDPATFNPANNGGWGHLGTACLVSGIVGAALYLKQHPVPDQASVTVIGDKTQVTQNIQEAPKEGGK